MTFMCHKNNTIFIGERLTTEDKSPVPGVATLDSLYICSGWIERDERECYVDNNEQVLD